MTDPFIGVSLAEIRESLAFLVACGTNWTPEKQARLEADILREEKRLAEWRRQQRKEIPDEARRAGFAGKGRPR